MFGQHVFEAQKFEDYILLKKIKDGSVKLKNLAQPQICSKISAIEAEAVCYVKPIFSRPYQLSYRGHVKQLEIEAACVKYLEEISR